MKVLKTFFLSAILLTTIFGAAWADDRKPVVVTDESLMSDVDLVRAKVLRFSENMNACLQSAPKMDIDEMKKCLCGFRTDFYRAYYGLGDLIAKNPKLNGVLVQYTPPGETETSHADLGAYAVMLIRYETHMCRL